MSVVEEVVLTDEALIEAEQCRRSLRTFVEAAWPMIEPHSIFVPNWHIDAMCEHLQAASQGQISFLIINVPPGTMKSINTSVMWPAWDWIDSPWRRFLTGSYGMDLSGRDSWKSRLLIQSPWYQDRWGDSFAMVGDRNKITNYSNDKGGYRLATSVNGATGQRANVRLLDDPHNITEGESDSVREGVIAWVKNVWSERGADAKTDIQVVVMQRVHERDVCGYYLNEDLYGKKHAVHLRLPMRYDPHRRCVTVLGFEDPRTEKDELLFPARMPEEVVLHKEDTLGEYMTASQLQQEPAPKAGGILKKHWWKFWKFPNMDVPPVPMEQPDGSIVMTEAVDLPYLFDEEATAWDMNFKDHDKVDYVAGLHGCKIGPDTYFTDHFRGRISFTDSVEAVRAMRGKHPRTSATLVEDAANGPAIISTLKSEIAGIIPASTAGGKESRVQAASHYLKAGNHYLPHPQLYDWVQPFIDECASFPKGRWDDQVDAYGHLSKHFYGESDQGIRIAVEYDPKFHLSDEPLAPAPGVGVTSFRFWYVDYWMCCIVGQMLPRGRIVIYDCILEANTTLEQLIDWRLQPILNERYRGCNVWRDVWNRPMPTAQSPESEHNLVAVVGSKLDSGMEVGEAKFENRVEAIKSVLEQVNRFLVNKEVRHVHDALMSRFMYPVGPDGLPRRDGPLRKHPGTAVGEALGHGLARLFVRRPTMPIRSPVKERHGRARSYAVG